MDLKKHAKDIVKIFSSFRNDFFNSEEFNSHVFDYNNQIISIEDFLDFLVKEFFSNPSTTNISYFQIMNFGFKNGQLLANLKKDLSLLKKSTDFKSGLHQYFDDEINLGDLLLLIKAEIKSSKKQIMSTCHEYVLILWENIDENEDDEFDVIDVDEDWLDIEQVFTQIPKIDSIDLKDD